MKSINVQYFALLREQRGEASETLEVTCETLGELYQHLKEKHQFTLPIDLIQVAVDDEFARHEHPLREGANVVFIPPVAGG